MRTNQGLARGIAIVVAAMSGLGVAAVPASAAALGTVTLSAAGPSPSSLAAAVGDTFVISNSSANQDFYIKGPITRTSDSRDCNVFCILTRESSATYRVDATSDVAINDYPGGGPGVFVGTLRLTSTPPPDPATIYPTLYLDPNGGRCLGTPLKYTKVNGMNDTVTLPAAGTCTRTDYTLGGWRQRAADGGIDRTWAPGETVPIGSSSFTLTAIWNPNGVEITYDANVAMKDACVGDSSNPSRITVVVAPLTGTLATTAPCTPTGNFVLGGWLVASSNSPQAGKVLPPGASVSGLLPPGQVAGRVTLMANWSTAAQRSITITGERTTVSGKPGIKITGTTTGLAAGTILVPYFRFPGETTYSQASARPTVLADGSFTWSRKTGKKFYAYVTTEDGQVTSNRVVIAAG